MHVDYALSLLRFNIFIKYTPQFAINRHKKESMKILKSISKENSGLRFS